MKTTDNLQVLLFTVMALLFVSAPALAQSDSDRIADLERQAAQMSDQLAALRSELARIKGENGAEEVAAIRSEAADARQAAQRAEQSASEWKRTTAVTHLAGYASAGFESPENGTSAFNANFNPVFHYQYNDRVLWEAELEFEVDDTGATDLGLEYSSIDVMLNDNLVLVAGKFLSPLGNFRQNLHPSWINKLPTAPPGFGHHGAAPLADIGVQLRGGVRVGDQGRVTYAGYIGNGPELEAEDGEIHAVESEGFAGDVDDEKIVGGRVGFLPIPGLELGVSAAAGDIAVVVNNEEEFSGDPKRDYRVFGVDGSYQIGDLNLRGEYMRQKVGAQALSLAPDSAEWKTWYVQGAYLLGEKWEGVVRYTDFQSPHEDDAQEQLAFGMNYLLSPNAMFKFAYEFNNGLAGEANDEDRFLAQIAYGY